MIELPPLVDHHCHGVTLPLGDARRVAAMIAADNARRDYGLR
jgi:hypothetical protein